MSPARTWLSPADVSELQGEPLSDRAIRLRVDQGRYGRENEGWRRVVAGRNGKGIQIALDALTAEEKARYYQQHPLAIVRVEQCEAEPRSRAHAYDNASASAKKRAVLRRAAVTLYQAKLAAWGDRRGVKQAKRRFAAEISAELTDLRGVSAGTLDQWLSDFVAYDLDGLVSDYTRCGRPASLPRRVKELFIARVTDGTAPTKKMAIFEARGFALRELDIDLSRVSDDAFYDIEIPQALLLATREAQDDEERVIYTMRRDHSFPALHIVVGDHHLTDRWVHCGEGGYVRQGDRLIQIPAGRICGPEGCRAGHRVWITAFMDVASRLVLGWGASLNYPNSDTIRRGLRTLIERHGLPNIIYVDNGKDYKSAFGRAIRAKAALPLQENLLNNLCAALGLQVKFAIPRRARSKSIERLFRTWVMQIWQGHPAYTGMLGKRTERAERCRKQPHLLISLEEFRAELQTHVDAYNVRRGHRGQGMNGRSPLEVFTASRIPERKPKSEELAYAFWRWYGRRVGAGGTVVIGSDRYIIDPIVAASGRGIGSYVQLLVNPEDVRRAIVFSGCEHTNSKDSRTRAMECSCRGKGLFLCEATLESLSSYVDAEVTADHVREANSINRELRRQIRTYRSSTARRDLDLFHSRRGEFLAAIAARTHEEQKRIAAVAGEAQPATPVVLAHSGIARAVDAYRSQIAGSSSLTDEQRRLARTVEDPDNDELRELASESRLRVVRSINRDDEPPVDVAALRQQRELETRLRERADAGYCTATIDCPMAGDPYCHQHAEELGDN